MVLELKVTQQYRSTVPLAKKQIQTYLRKWHMPNIVSILFARC